MASSRLLRLHKFRFPSFIENFAREYILPMLQANTRPYTVTPVLNANLAALHAQVCWGEGLYFVDILKLQRNRSTFARRVLLGPTIFGLSQEKAFFCPPQNQDSQMPSSLLGPSASNMMGNFGFGALRAARAQSQVCGCDHEHSFAWLEPVVVKVHFRHAEQPLLLQTK